MNGLKLIRMIRGISQQKLAEIIGVSRVMVSYYENDHNKPRKEKREKISRVLGIAERQLWS